MKQDTDIYYKLGEIHGDVKNILVEAKKTNGRVTKLETETVPKLKEEVEDIKVNMARWMGGLAVIIFLLNYLAPKILDKIQ